MTNSPLSFEGALANITSADDLHRLVDHFPKAVLICAERRLLFANTAAAGVFGYASPAEIVALKDIGVLFPNDAETFHQFGIGLHGGYIGVRRDGVSVRLELDAVQLDWDGTQAVGLIMDEFGESDEDVYRRLLGNVPHGIFCSMLSGEVLIANPALASLLGYDGVDDLKAHILDRKDGVYVDDNQRKAMLERLRTDGHVKNFQTRWRRKNDDVIWVSLDITAVRSPGGEMFLEGAAVEITEQRDSAKSLIEAKEAAELASRAKSEFLAHMSHELRTPLNCVIGFSQILMSEMFGPLGSDNYKTYAADIHTAGNHLLALISDILDISKVEAGELELTESIIDVDTLLINCMTMMRDRADAKGVILSSEFDHDLPKLEADELRVKQILLNLLSNAVKFTPPGGQVSARARREIDNGIIIEVEDTGDGIHPKDLERVQLPFEQARHSSSIAQEGTGLGLYLTKALAGLHDATFAITSEVGKGTQVIVHFPPERTVTAA